MLTSSETLDQPHERTEIDQKVEASFEIWILFLNGYCKDVCKMSCFLKAIVEIKVMTGSCICSGLQSSVYVVLALTLDAIPKAQDEI